MKKNLLIVLATLTFPTVTFADSCNYDKAIEFTIDARSIENLNVDVGAGELTIQGDANTTDVTVTAVACASSRSRLDDVDLVHRRNGSDLEVFTEIENRGSFFFGWGNRNAYIDIEMVVPEGLSLEVDDGSGPVSIAGVSALSLEDGSGSVNISNILGDVYVDDGSGSIEISNVDGLVSIDDGSGDLRILESNAVHVIDDGSGDIHITDIAQNVYIQDDGSGDIDIQDVGGDVDIGSPGSGSVNVSGVAGNY